MTEQETFRAQARQVYRIFLGFFALLLISGSGLAYYLFNPDLFDSNLKSKIVMAPVELDEDLIENGIHVRTGLVDAEGLMLVVNNCTNCHSAKLVTQNRMTAEGWNVTIKWMQETQNLWDLGGNQELIVNYLVDNYPLIAKGRRMVLKDIEWYELEN